MPLWAQFVGGAYRARSRNLANEACINLYLETQQTNTEPKGAMLLGTPGLKPFATSGGPTGARGAFAQNGRAFMVIGDRLLEVFSNGSVTDRGGVIDDGAPASMTSNSAQLLISSGGALSVLDLNSNVLTGVAWPGSNPPLMVGYLDQRALALEANSRNIWYSDIDDFTTWGALSEIVRETTADNIVGFCIASQRIWVFGSDTSEVYQNTADPDNPFQRIDGSNFQIGLIATWGIGVFGETITWPGRSVRGPASIYRINGYNGEPISTKAVDYQLQSYDTLTDGESLVYEQDGHVFSILNFADADATWCLDLAEPTLPWHQRAAWDDGAFVIWRPRVHLWAFDKHLVGSRDSGDIWELDLATYDDDGDILNSLRRAPYLGAENQWSFLNTFEMGIESGVGTESGQGVDPHWMFRLSKDSGNTWAITRELALGSGILGEYNARAKTEGLGRARLDRIVTEVSCTDPVKRVIGPGVWLRAIPGTGQL